MLSQHTSERQKILLLLLFALIIMHNGACELYLRVDKYIPVSVSATARLEFFHLKGDRPS